MKEQTRKFKVTHKTLGKLEVSIVVLEPETTEELYGDAGGEAKVLESMNWSKLHFIKSKVNGEAQKEDSTDTVETFLERCQSIAADAQYYSGRTGATRQDKIDFAEALAQAKAAGELDADKMQELAKEYGVF